MLRRAIVAGLMALGLSACASTAKQAAMTGPVGEAGWFDINGVEQWVAMKGDDAGKPVLLWLHGGPGIAMSSSMPLFREWERDFVVVQWDQPGGGGTGVRHLSNPGELTLDRYAKDGVAVAEMLRRKFGKRKIALIGISWGSQLGVEMVKRRPDLFSVYVGTAQVTGARGVKRGYELALEAARARGDKTTVAALEGAGPPPYDDFNKLLVRQQYTNPPGQPPTPQETAKGVEAGKLMAANPLEDKYKAYPAPPEGFVPARDGAKMFLDTVNAVMMGKQDWDIRGLGRDWPVPVFVFQGDNDFNAPTELAKEWVEEIRAPKKAFEIIPGAGHNTVLFHAELLALMKTHGVPEIAAKAD